MNVYASYPPAFSIFDKFNNYLFAVTQTAGNVYARGAYGNVSDSNLKENIVLSRDYTDDLCKINVVNFNFKEPDFISVISTITSTVDITDASGNFITTSNVTRLISSCPIKHLGFIAQQVHGVFPSLAELTYTTNEETSEVISTFVLKTSVFTPMIVTAIQNFKRRIDKLETSLSTLEVLYDTRMSYMESTINGLVCKA